jgi:CspA family cold shock protein
MESGTICAVRADKGYGFIAPTGGGDDLFFHHRDLIDLEFDEQLRERRVRFNIISTDKGQRAKNVQAE